MEIKEGKILFFQILNEKFILSNISCELVKTSYDIINNIGIIKYLIFLINITSERNNL